MIEKIAAIIAAALVPKVIEILQPIVVKLAADLHDKAVAEIREASENAIKFAITQLDHNKDGKVDLKDLFNR